MIDSTNMRLPLMIALLSTASLASASRETTEHVIEAHGIIMSLAFLIFFPLGALTIRLSHFRGRSIWIHGPLQISAYIVALAGFGMGVWIAYTTNQLREHHSIIGIILIALLLIQPILSLTHHRIYRRDKKRTKWAVSHVWLGRSLLTLGVINGGLGIQLSENTRGSMVAYGVVAAVVFLLYVAVVVFSDKRSRETGGSSKKIDGLNQSAVSLQYQYERTDEAGRA